jgi:YidC/Oxa1 family membrane protein insertase
MDLQRTLLIGAIALLSFMLLTEWVAFKETKIVPVAPETRLVANNGSPAELPDAPEFSDSAAAEEDIPSAPLLKADAKADMPKEAVVSSGRIIQVYTDSLQLAIDLKGGDIVELALPRHLEKLDNPDAPFLLLEQNDNRIYIAQSGLVGPDGIDSEGRAEFTASSDRYEMADGATELQVDLHYQNESGIKITKRYTLHRGDYLVEVEYLIENNSSSRWQSNLFGQIKRDSSAPPSADSSGMGMKPFLGAAITQPEDHFTKFTFDDMAEEPFKAQLPGGWIAMIQHYFPLCC